MDCFFFSFKEIALVALPWVTRINETLGDTATLLSVFGRAKLILSGQDKKTPWGMARREGLAVTSG